MKWAGVNKRSDEHPESPRRLVAQALRYRERRGEHLVGTPSLTIVKLLLSVAAEEDLPIMLLHAKCWFLDSSMRRSGRWGGS